MMRSLMVGVGSVLVGLLGGNLVGVTLFAFWTPAGTPGYDNPGGVVLALLQGAASVFLTYYLCRKLSNLKLARKVLLAAACVACAIFAATNFLILGFSDGPMPWQAAASIASFAPWLVATLRPRLLEDLTV
jgi:hypothetical protein